jgi:hypothetical protein
VASLSDSDLFIVTDSCSRRINDTKKADRKDFIHYILKQSEHYDLSQDEVIVNAALFMCVRAPSYRAYLLTHC